MRDMKKSKKVILIILTLSLILAGIFAYYYMSTPKKVTYRYGTDLFKDSEYIDTDQPELNEEVSDNARDKYTELKGKGKDTITVLFYIIGNNDSRDSTDMINTLNNIAYAKDSSHLNVVIQTGGSSCWNSQVLKDGTIQRWVANSDSLTLLDDSIRYTSMCDPDCLKDFLLSSMTRYPADRYELFMIGQGSFDSFGYDPDETFTSLSYQSISKILSTLPSPIDILGIDAPYASSITNAILFEPYADYMIAFESQIVSSGMVYQSFLSRLAENSSASSLQAGKLLIDSYAMNYAQKNYSVPYVLSLTDLSEIHTIRDTDMSQFGKEMSALIDNGTYQTISDVLSSATEIGPVFESSHIDITHFAKRLSTTSAKTLYNDLLSCIKYRRTRESLNAYGLSTDLSYRYTKDLSSALYPDDYISFVQKFQLYSALARTYSTLVYPSLSNQLANSTFTPSEEISADTLITSDYLSQFFPSNSSFNEEELKKAAEYILSQQLNTDHLKLKKTGDTIISPLDENDLSMIHDIHKVFYMKKNQFYVHIGNSQKITYNALNQPELSLDDSWYYMNSQPVPFIPLSSDLNSNIIGYARANINDTSAYLLFSKKSYELAPSVIGYISVHDDSNVTASDITPLKGNEKIAFLYDTFQPDGSYNGLLPMSQPFSAEDLKVTSNPLSDDIICSLSIQNFYHSSFYTQFIQDSLTDSQ